MYDASNRRHVADAAKAAKAVEQERLNIVRGIMSLKAGRAYIHDELVACHVFATSFTTDALQMAFSEGERNRGLRLLNDVTLADPEGYVDMMREANERQLAADRRRNQHSEPTEPGPAEDPGDASDDPAEPGFFDPIEESIRLLDEATRPTGGRA